MDTRSPEGGSHRHARDNALHRSLALLRISLGWIFLWAFLDKTLGLGYATPSGNAWIRGGSPTSGFLANATSGPLQDLFQALSGSALVDWLFMLGLLGIGLALLLGVGMKIAAWSGSTLLLLMWLALLPTENNPFLDDHLVYAIALFACQLGKAGRTWGLGTWWSNTGVVQRYPVLE